VTGLRDTGRSPRTTPAGSDYVDQDRAPNFRDGDNLYLVRCFACEPERDSTPAVATGRCAWCGWNEDDRV
jgi:hypothetical protein